MKERFPKAIEILFILVVSFVVIILVFVGLSFGFKQFRAMTGNAVSDETVISNSYAEWIVITLISTMFVIAILEYVIKKRLFRIKWNLG